MLLFAAALLDAGTLTLVAAELVRSLQADLSSGQAGGVSPPPRRRPLRACRRPLTLLLDHAAAAVILIVLLAGTLGIALGTHQPASLDHAQAVVAVQADPGGGGTDPNASIAQGLGLGPDLSATVGTVDPIVQPLQDKSVLDNVTVINDQVTQPVDSNPVAAAPSLDHLTALTQSNDQSGDNRKIVNNACGGAGGADAIAGGFNGGDPSNPPINSGCNVDLHASQDLPMPTPWGLGNIKVPTILPASAGGGGGGGGGGGSKGKGDPNAIPDNSLVVRGGTNTPENFAKASGSWTDENGRVWDVSVKSASDKTFEELTQGIPHKQVGQTTAGSIRGKGGVITPDPRAGNLDHCLTGGCTADEFSSLFTPTKKNPNVK